MLSPVKSVAVVIALLAAFSVFAERPPFERYQCLIDSHPFGVPPAGFDPNMNPSDAVAAGKMSAAELSAEQEQMQKAIEFKTVMVGDDGRLQVGFRDISDPKSSKFYLMAVGETNSVGWYVKSANAAYGDASMTVVKDSIELTLRLGEDAKSEVAAPAQPPRGRQGGGPRVMSAAPSSVRPTSFSGRRARRVQEEVESAKQEEERKRREEEAKTKAEEERAAREEERRQQREQLMQIQEELRRSREERRRAEEAREVGGGGVDDSAESEVENEEN